MKYSWLFFDADGTLFNFDAAQDSAIEQTFSSLGIPFKNKYHRIYYDINKAIWAQFEKKEIEQNVIPVQRFNIFFEEINVQADANKASRLYLEFLSQSDQLIDGAESLIEKLSGEYKLLLITNGLKSVQRPRFSKSSITKYFDEIVISEEVGSAKPHKKIFDLTFDKIGNPNKKEVLIIGDNLGSDILGGQNYGIDTCWFNPENNVSQDGIIPTYEIKNLINLVSILNARA
ncbi:MAG: noncanonical pyrimidine nucleotidase, YjjG family [Calditrichaeota bacterium]|nr:MAG: noncanonical pyrimidine nucleotidase, YjjG family [Calditrichota bacterium]MBL1204333.1 noncanonical pyrimidine nucleotidase, YjjG family [Calditrichota bacterium]NOG44162.1 noncanonical pyrimidine nucleotidase, YjjG family [Calditrichota bacterium]